MHSVVRRLCAGMAAVVEVTRGTRHLGRIVMLLHQHAPVPNSKFVSVPIVATTLQACCILTCLRGTTMTWPPPERSMGNGHSTRNKPLTASHTIPSTAHPGVARPEPGHVRPGGPPGAHARNDVEQEGSPRAGASPNSRALAGQSPSEVHGHTSDLPASPMSRSLPRSTHGSGNYAVPSVQQEGCSTGGSNQGPLKAASVNQLQAEYAVLAQRLEDETREKEQLEQQLASLKKEADNLKHRLSVFEQQQQAMNRAGGSMNYCQAPGARDAYFDRERLTTCMEDGLEKALDTVVDLLHKHASGPYQAELTRFMQPLLQFIDPQEYRTPRAQKHALRHSLLLRLDTWVWAPAADSKGISDDPIARALANACPALGLRPIVYKAMVKRDGPEAVSSLNKLLCAVQTSSRDWYQLWEPILKDSTSNYADLLGNAVRPLLVPQLLGADMGLPSLAADEGAVAELEEPMYRLLFTAVMLRLCAEASHPAHLVEVTAGTRRWAYNLAPRANPELYGGVGNEACRRTFAWSSQLHPSAAALAASPVGCVAGCYRPGIRLQQSLMLVDLNSTTRRVFDERYVSLGQK